MFGWQQGTHNTRMRSRVILDRGMSMLSTWTSTFSPGPKPRLLLFFVLESFASVTFRIGISPVFPTPISTKIPNRVAFSTLPVRIVPTCRSSRQTMLLLKSGLLKSAWKGKQVSVINKTLYVLDTTQHSEKDLQYLDYMLRPKLSVEKRQNRIWRHRPAYKKAWCGKNSFPSIEIILGNLFKHFLLPQFYSSNTWTLGQYMETEETSSILGDEKTSISIHTG